jgi:DNA-binding transcriptional MocR family regulator
MLAPSVRLGWLVAPPALIPKITVIRESMDLESSILTQSAVYEFLSRGLLESHLARLNAENQARRDALIAALQAQFGAAATWTCPQGGLFLWLMLRDDIDTTAAFQDAVDRQVIYIPGAAFSIDGHFHNAMRLNFSTLPPDLLTEAVERLASVFLSIPE